jgi:ubiquinone/menaquinone biosynthesis C-methylase UbiE
MSTQELIQQLLRPDRVHTLDPSIILALLGINPHDKLADIGCGPGYFTVPMAKIVIRGKLYALDIDGEMLAACRDRVAKARLGNVEVLKCDEFDFPLDQGSLDGEFMAFVVQQSADKTKLLRASRELLKPKGWCSILEWYRKETETGPPLERRVDPADLESLATDAGFRYLGWRDLNGEQYIMNLRNR